MTDPVTNNRSLVQPTVGSDLNVWGGYLNNGVIAAVDAVLGTNLAVSMTSADVSLTASQFQNAIFIVSGALTGNHSLIIPLSPNSGSVACGGPLIVVNNTTGAHTLTVLTAASGSTGVTVPQGFTAYLYSDGTNVGYAQSGLPAFAAAVNGDPNGQLAGTAGSVNTNASLAYDYTNNIIYVCISTGPASGGGQAVWLNPILSSLTQPPPEGYLTPVSGQAIITTDSIGATAIYYTPYVGTWAAYHNGISIVPFKFTEMQLSLSPSQAANNIYDIFLAYNGGSPVIGTGPSWAAGGGSITAGSCARGTGAGSSAISRDSGSGLWVNTNSMSGFIYNTGSGNNTITVAAGQGIYLGSIFVDATAGQVTCHRSYGQSRKWGLWNAYNRVPIVLQGGDPTASWSLAGITAIRSSNGNSANSMTIFSGLAEEIPALTFQQLVSNSVGNGTGNFNIGIGYNSTAAFSGTVGNTPFANLTSSSTRQTNANYTPPPFLGINTVNCLEQTTVANMSANGTQANMLIRAAWRG